MVTYIQPISFQNNYMYTGIAIISPRIDKNIIYISLSVDSLET